MKGVSCQVRLVCVLSRRQIPWERSADDSLASRIVLARSGFGGERRWMVTRSHRCSRLVSRSHPDFTRLAQLRVARIRSLLRFTFSKRSVEVLVDRLPAFLGRLLLLLLLLLFIVFLL